MSEDETDIEEIPRRSRDPIRQRKRFRRVELGFRSSDVGKLLRDLDNHHREKLPLGSAPSGNPPSERILAPQRTDWNRVVKGLPKNFYSETWLSRLTNLRRQCLQMKDNSEQLVHYVEEAPLS
jgi:hypothetical protein